MKVIGVILIVLGVGLTIFSGFNYVRESSVGTIGNMEITKPEDANRYAWSPFAGIACLSLGGVILLLTVRKRE